MVTAGLIPTGLVAAGLLLLATWLSTALLLATRLIAALLLIGLKHPGLFALGQKTGGVLPPEGQLGGREGVDGLGRCGRITRRDGVRALLRALCIGGHGNSPWFEVEGCGRPESEPPALAETYLKDHSLGELYDNVIVPALVLAEHDRHRGALPGEGSGLAQGGP